jgi:hypothetical protein
LGSVFSPNFEKKPFFFGCFAWSSFNPTSSNPSSAVGGCLSNRLSLIADRGSLGNRAESRLWRPKSLGRTGDLAEISNDLLYESNDSREIEKGSMSDSLSRVAVVVPEGFVRRGQKPFFSGGDGGRYTPLSLTTLILYSTGSELLLLLMLRADDFDPIVSTFSKVGRVPFCDRGRTPSSAGCKPVCTSGRFANGFRMGMLICGVMWGAGEGTGKSIDGCCGMEKAG